VIENNLNMGTDDFVDCACSHMTSYAVIAEVYDAGIVGYTVWFFAACFICMVRNYIDKDREREGEIVCVCRGGGLWRLKRNFLLVCEIMHLRPLLAPKIKLNK
jgi:hypothetical protein